MMPYAPMAPPMPPPMMLPKKSKIPLLIVIFAVLGLVFVGISLAMPWYSLKIEYSGGDGASGKVEVSYTFSGVDSKFDMTVLGQTITSTNHTAWADEKNVDKTKGVYQLTMVMVILALAMLLLLLVGGVMLMKGPEKKMLAVIFGVMAFVFALIGPVMFIAMLPGATNDDMNASSSSGITNSTGDGPHKSFTGSTDSSLGKLSWGPGIGWIMGILAFIFALLGFILALMVKKPVPAPMGAAPMPWAPMPPPMEQPPMQQQPMYQPPPQQPPMYQPPQQQQPMYQPPPQQPLMYQPPQQQPPMYPPPQ